MLKKWAAYATVAVSLGVHDIPLASADKTESFNSAASAAANGWTVVGTGLDGQVAGWIDTMDAGGTGGEAQYDVRRGAELSYADTNLGLVVNGNGGFTMSGKINVVGHLGVPDTGFPSILGFFSTTQDYIGFFFRGDDADLGLTEAAWGLRFENTGDGIRIGSGGDFSRILTEDVPRTFSLVYDPAAGSFGSIVASISDAGNPITHFLSETNRTLLNEASFTKFGLMKRGNGANPNGLDIRIDDVTYTGVAGSPSIPGDFNGDTQVNSTDLDIWSTNFSTPSGATTAMGDADLDGDVDGNDFLVWQRNVTGPGAAAIPEPSSLALAFAAALLALKTKAAKRFQRSKMD